MDGEGGGGDTEALIDRRAARLRDQEAERQMNREGERPRGRGAMRASAGEE